MQRLHDGRHGAEGICEALALKRRLDLIIFSSIVLPEDT